MPHIKVASPQTSQVYQLLSNGQALTAREMAAQLGALPNAIYRVAKKLVDMGMVEQLNDYPVRFKAVPAQMAMSLYLTMAAQNFKREFGLSQLGPTGDAPTITLIKDRPALLRRVEADTRSARQSFDIIISGHEVSDSLMLAYRKAATVGVLIRKIIHQVEQTTPKHLAVWKEMGIRVRYLPDLDIRLIVFDKRVVYLTSYDLNKPGRAFGVRFDYVPLALQMSEVFEQNWQRAKPL